MTVEAGHVRHVPEVRFPEDLPVSERREEIADTDVPRIDLHISDRCARFRDGTAAAEFVYEI